jgi:Domain of unknown function (DUF4184)
MPWTFAHPAAVLPFRKLGLKNLSFGGLVVGSISPDIGYYIGRFDLAALAHTTLGVLMLCLPTGLVLFALVRALHRPVAKVLPEPHRSALLSMPQVPSLTSLRFVFAIAVSIIIGAMTHNAWDSFTHPTGYMVAKLPLLRESVWMLGNRNVRVYELLQHASTLFGLVVIVMAYAKWLKGVNVSAVAPVLSRTRNLWRYALLFALAAGAMILTTIVTYEMSGSGKINGALTVVRFVICATTIFVVALCSIALLLSRRGKRML